MIWILCVWKKEKKKEAHYPSVIVKVFHICLVFTRVLQSMCVLSSLFFKNQVRFEMCGLFFSNHLLSSFDFHTRFLFSFWFRAKIPLLHLCGSECVCVCLCRFILIDSTNSMFVRSHYSFSLHQLEIKNEEQNQQSFLVI